MDQSDKLVPKYSSFAWTRGLPSVSISLIRMRIFSRQDSLSLRSELRGGRFGVGSKKPAWSRNCVARAVSLEFDGHWTIASVTRAPRLPASTCRSGRAQVSNFRATARLAFLRRVLCLAKSSAHGRSQLDLHILRPTKVLSRFQRKSYSELGVKVRGRARGTVLARTGPGSVVTAV
jgi:hypothetical protein